MYVHICVYMYILIKYKYIKVNTNISLLRYTYITFRQLHLELCRIAHDINDFFGMQVTLQMLSCFFIFTEYFVFQYYTILNLNKFYIDEIAIKMLLACNMWFIIFLMKLLSLNHVCESVSAKVHTFNKL